MGIGKKTKAKKAREDGMDIPRRALEAPSWRCCSYGKEVDQELALFFLKEHPQLNTPWFSAVSSQLIHGHFYKQRNNFYIVFLADEVLRKGFIWENANDKYSLSEKRTHVARKNQCSISAGYLWHIGLVSHIYSLCLCFSKDLYLGKSPLLVSPMSLNLSTLPFVLTS